MALVTTLICPSALLETIHRLRKHSSGFGVRFRQILSIEQSRRLHGGIAEPIAYPGDGILDP
ncbi:MAG TPA: hypothetical protein VIG24_00640, partial [Acidimicrobiia bacterium]